jgi:hypothetical protein
VSTLLHGTVYVSLQSLLNVLVQIANKMGLQKKISNQNTDWGSEHLSKYKVILLSSVTISILDIIRCLVFYLNTTFRSWILSPSSGGIYSHGPNIKS